MASSTGTGAGVFQTSPTITTPTIDTITSAASTALTLKSAGTTAVTIDTSQRVTIPNQVSVCAFISGNQSIAASGTIQVTLNSTGYNIGSAFNTSTYRFTAPVAGRYLVLGVTEMAGPPTQNHTGLTINGTTSSAKGLPDQFQQCSASNAYSSGQNAVHKNAILNLSANDYVELWVFNAGSGTYLYSGRTNMTITLLG
jgi:hypothetical protein